MLLLAWAVDAGLRTRCYGLVGVVVLSLAALMPLALARIYLIQHKTDWRTLAARVEGDDPRLPVCFYEDIGEEAFAYYARDRSRLVRLDQPFGDQGAGWRAAGYFDRFHSYTGGFWMVFYLTFSETRAEEAAIRTALRREFAVEEVEAPSPLKLLHCRPLKQPRALNPLYSNIAR
jgi:hypothetical protein